MAGVLGSGLYLLFSATAGLSNFWIYLLLSPFAFLYVLCYFVMLRPPSHYARYLAAKKERRLMHPPSSSSSQPILLAGDTGTSATVEVTDASGGGGGGDRGGGGDDSDPRSGETQPLLGTFVSVQQGEQAATAEGVLAVAAHESQPQRHWRIFISTLWWGVNLGAVYFFEYVASTGAADRANPPGALHSNNWALHNSYAILSFVYQLGVLISRSSLKVVKVRRVEVLTVLQALNFGLWLAQDSVHFLPIYAQIVLMLFVGCGMCVCVCVVHARERVCVCEYVRVC
jgi:CLN3 protein